MTFPRRSCNPDDIAMYKHSRGDAVRVAALRSNQWPRRVGILIVSLFAIIGGRADLVAAAEESSAQRSDRLKASYLLNFAKFVEWPASVPGTPLTVCFVGGQGVFEELASGIERKVVGERHLAARKLSESEAPVGCDVLYLDATKMPEGARVPNTGEGPILTVSDAKAFAHSGGMIELFTDANHLRFNINVASAQKAGLHISSNLLELAAAVEQAQPP
jgi:hypothetical protein